MGEHSGTGRMDLTGDRYGKLTVTGPASDIGGKPVWRCKCDCGNEIDVRANNLRAGRTKSCGCLRSPKRELAGMKFGRLTVLEQAENMGRSTAWRCKCECGKEVVVRTASLVSGLTTSCGCLAAELHRESRADLTGQTFGKLTALEPAGKRGQDTVWRCRCECGKEAVVTAGHLRSGWTKSCGCLRGLKKKDAGV